MIPPPPDTEYHPLTPGERIQYGLFFVVVFGMLAVQSLALSATIGIVVNLVPHGVMTQKGFVANDGLGMLRSFSLSDDHFAEWIQADEEMQEMEDEEYRPYEEDE